MTIAGQRALLFYDIDCGQPDAMPSYRRVFCVW